MPKTILGKCSVWLIVSFGVAMMLFNFAAIISGIPGMEGSIVMLVILATSLIIAAIMGISSLVTGLISVIFLKERKTIIWVSIFLGSLVLFYTMGELLFSH